MGGGFVAFITVLDIIPRLAHLSRGEHLVRGYEWALISGATLWTVADQFDLHIELPRLFLMLLGIFTGIFVGMLAGALTEVLNVIPILAKRIRLSEKILVLLLAMILGKVLGSLFQWTMFH